MSSMTGSGENGSELRRGIKRVTGVLCGFYPVDVVATWADVSKAERWLGRRVQVAYNEGIGRLVAWYRANRAWDSLVEV